MPDVPFHPLNYTGGNCFTMYQNLGRKNLDNNNFYLRLTFIHVLYIPYKKARIWSNVSLFKFYGPVAWYK